jgi:hypothetical protein
MVNDFIEVEMAQMIGRCGCQQLGFVLLRRRGPLSHDAVVKSIVPPLPTADRDVFLWSLLRLALRAVLDKEANASRIGRRLVYWLARRSSLPSADWHRVGDRRRRSNLELLLGPRCAESGVPSSAVRIRAWMSQLVTKVSAQDAHWAKPGEVALGRIADFAVATAWSAFGYVTDWYLYVPREDLALVLEGTAVYARAISDFAATALDHSNAWPRYSPLVPKSSKWPGICSHTRTNPLY